MKNGILQLKRVAFALLVLLLSVTGVKTTNAQSTVGNDFWVTFLPNYETDADHPLTLSLIATASSPCSGTITNPYTDWSTSFEVSVGATTIIDIPSSEAYSDDDSDDVVNIGLHVVSTEPISLFASNFRPYTFDVTDVLPTYSLGSNYIIQTYNESNRSIAMNPSSHTNSRSDGSCSEFTVLAVEDNTTVYITLADNSMNGHYSNQPFSVTLNTGQCYQIKSVNGGNFSGSQVSVSGNKKVAVFAGNRCTNVPYGCAYCDHIVEQMMPVSCWGNHFVVTNSSMRTYDVIRVTAANDNCQISIDGSVVTTINQKETYQFEITSDNPSMYLETSQPAMVYLYYAGSQCAGEMGDPSMVMISPIEQRMNYVTFSTFNSGASQYHFVNIITDTEDVSSVQLDGNSIASEFQNVSGNAGYSFARVQIEHGSHTLLTTGGGFVAHVYGLGNDESYAYSVGSNAVQELFTNMLVNGQTASDDMDVCGKTVSFDLNYNYNVSQVNWSFGDGQTGSGIPITHEYANEGDYPVSCEVFKLDSYGQDSLVATLSTVLHIYDSYETELSVTSYSSYSWMGHTYSFSGDYVYQGQTIHGCDSIITLHLTIPTLQVIAEYYPDVDNPNSQYARVYWNEFTGGAPFEAQIGEGTSTFSYFPFYTYYNYSIAENLFLASELEEAGVTIAPMNSLSWYATNAPGYAQQGISIWMANVEDVTLTSTSHVVTDMTLVYTGAMTPEIGWNEFVFNEGTFAWDGHSNILIYCQRNNGAWNNGVSWQATSDLPFTASTYKYQDSGAYDPTVANSMNTSTTRPNIIMKSNGSRTENLTYCIYRANCNGSGIQMIADNVTENQYIDSEWSGLYPGSYKYGVSVVDGRGNASEIQWNDSPVAPNHHTLDASAFQPPVTNNSHYGELRVNCENGRHNNDVTISTGAKNNRDYLQYCTDNYAGGVGTGGGAVYWGIRFPAADLTAYAGQSLTKVGIFTDTDGDYGWTYSGYYTVNVYLGGATAPSTLVSSVSEYVPGDFAWHDITLTTPVTIDATQDLWLTIYTPDIAYPMSGCDYVGNSNSDFLSLDGFTWEHSADYGLNYTWMIRGCVGEGDSTEITWSNCLWKPGNTINPQSTIGNDFWVTFLPNHDGSVNLSLIATGSSPCTGTVTNPYTNWTTEFEVSVGATTIINIPSNEAFSNGASDCVLNTSLHIVTSDFISLYASNFQEFTFDVTDVLPTPSLGSNYIIQTYPGEEGRGAMVQPSSDSRSLAQGCSEFAVIAVEDNTTVYITLTCDSQNGHYANQPFSVTLNTGECYQVKSITDGNLSGSQISVSGNKKIAVFAGNSCANVPTNCPYCDHIVEQMLPVSSWGNHFVVTGSSMRTYDIVRVTAASDDCQIFINNSLVTTINERETYQFEISSDDPSLYLETSKPAMVYLYYVGSECAGQMGDPSMVIISPIEQRMDYVTFSTFNSGASQYHFVNVITNTEDVNTVLLDGNNIASQFQTVSGNSDYSFARVAIEHGSHTLFTFGSGFVAHVYGLGDDESYAYSVGSNAAQELYTNILVNGQTASDDMNVCDNTVIFDLNYNYDVSQVNWSFGDGQTGSGIPITHEFANLGDYPVSCDVYKLDGNGNDSLVGTFSTILHIYESYYTEFEVTAHNYYTWEWMGETFYESGDYSYNGQTIHGCDSIVTLHLTITHEITATAVPEAGGTVVGGGMYNQGQTCTLSATANEGFEFMFWTDLNGAVVSYDMEYTFIVTEDMAFTAHFVGEDYCVIIFDLYDSYGDGWNGNQLVLNFDDGTTQQITFNSGSYASETLLFENGSHIVLTWISGSYIGECSFTVSYSDGTVIYEGTNLNGTSFEFNVNCNGSSDFTQVSELAAGWNWWSTYVEQEGIDGLTMLEESLGENGYQIKSQTDFVTNYGTMWFGMLSSINNEEMYMIDNTSSCQVVLTGAPVTPSDHPITVSSGWNWIGYPCTNTMSVSEAFADYTPANGDQVKSQADYAMYFSGMWIGQLQSITPGTGLMYLSNNTTSTTLVYPDGGRSTEIPTLPKATHWTNDIHAYPHNMTVMAVVELDDVELTTDNYELAAFDANGECRGSAKLTYVEPLDRHVAFLTIAGNDAVELNFGLYNMETGREYYNMEEALVYATNATIGTPEEPYVVSFRSTTGLEELDNSVQIFPNPAQAGERINILTTVDSKHPIHVEIVNALGATVAYETFTGTPASFVTPKTAGVYMLRIYIDGWGTYCKKLIIK